MYRFEQACRPVLFEIDNNGYPYWGKGSSVLVANRKYFYWITAKHVIGNMGGSPEALRIFPSDSSRISLPYDQKYTIQPDGSDDKDFKDIIILRVDLDDFERSGDTPLVAQDIEAATLDPDNLTSKEELFVVAYPSESRFVDYEERKIHQTRTVIRGLYEGRSISNHCHTLKVSTTIELEDYDGLSGAPIFVFRNRMQRREMLRIPLLTGLALRGSKASRDLHFVGVHVIVNAIRCAETP
jgi:hypothetical protein